MSRSLFLSLLAISLLTIFAQLAPVHPFLEWDRQAIASGQWWRILTGNITHTNWPHLAMNLAGLAILTQLFRFHLTTARLVTILFALGIIVGLSLFFTELERYAGLSGILHGLFIWGAWQDIRQHRSGGKLLLAAGFVKVGWDIVTGGSAETASLIQASIAVEAHLAGALGGLALAYTFDKIQSHRSVSQH
ncbi:rhombosortase [Photobacterium sp. CCB-ST2H9]|uniref:rhombosortase n=1 Tax=Photobacterium sp. CCB-ST2H9 TaxID=2912855 RepID=UPI0020029B46|nr:rhombosortase [Photobacterium sp. CCB-ST2H9]UTM56520.1 rhombosortase [Photobacterium sp. CCB-ST2H9]